MSQKVPDIEKILSRLRRVRSGGTNPWKWTAECPCRDDDRNPSLSIGQTDDLQVIFKCHREPSGCDLREICRAIDVEIGDLWPGPSYEGSRREESYIYKDSTGEPVQRVIRYGGSGTKKGFSQGRYENGKWESGAPAKAERPLYRLPEVLAQVEAGGVVYVVEGEKDVHTLENLGEVATTNSGGAGNWLPHHTESLAGATVIIIADNDQAGIDHSLQVAEQLRATGSNVQILQTTFGNDISEHVGAGYDLSDLLPLPAGIQDDFTDFVRYVGEVDPTLSLEMKWEMAREMLGELRGDAEPGVRNDSLRDRSKDSEPIDLSDRDLSGVDLGDQDLRGHDLTGLKLIGANLERVLLSGANISDANLTQAKLIRVDLSGVSARRANLTEAKLTGAILRDADLTETNFTKARLYSTDLTGADACGADFTGALLEKALFRGVDLTGATLVRAVLRKAVLSGTKLYAANLAETDLTEANLQWSFADKATIWPKGFNPEAAGVVVTNE